MAKTWLAALVLVACSLTMTAQSDNNQRMSREQLAEAQAKHIASELGLDEGTTKKYVETFCDYQKEIWALGPRETGKKKAEMTNAETDQEIQARFERSEKILRIRQKYYKRYSQFLTPKQIDRAYTLEREAMKRLARHGHKGQHGKKDGGRR
ncbi:MAG: hypothetical protein IKZ92_05200, partial [Muribaculaceae bacterium]|nr:hypothetical protein [Muribaculaceae bacterium]